MTSTLYLFSGQGQRPLMDMSLQSLFLMAAVIGKLHGNKDGDLFMPSLSTSAWPVCSMDIAMCDVPARLVA